MTEKLIIPRLRVRKDWYQNLAPDPTDHSHPDIGVFPDAQDGTKGDFPSYDAAQIFKATRTVQLVTGDLKS